MWGGEDEYLADLEAGTPNPRNWQTYAVEIVEKAASPSIAFSCLLLALTSSHV